MGEVVEAPMAVANALATVLSRSFVCLAFSLPPLCTSSIWEVMKGEIRADAGGYAEITSVDDLLDFLRAYFAPQILDQVCQHFKFLKSSCLGEDYSWRYGKAGYACKMVDDLITLYVCGEGPLKGFLGEAVDSSEGPALCPRPVKGMNLKNRDLDGDRKGKGGGRDGDGNNGGGQPNRGSSGGASKDPGSPKRGGAARSRGHFNVEVVTIILPAFGTPSKPPKADSVEGMTLQEATQQCKSMARDRNLKISDRSGIFMEAVAMHLDAAVLYNPRMIQRELVDMYHGTRLSSWNDSFQQTGIRLISSGSEFSATGAFYLSNSIRQSFEHPMHVHPVSKLDSKPDPVAVLAFKIDTRILHGISRTRPARDAPTLTCKWFRNADRRWAQFCQDNLSQKFQEKDDDVVIGPICKPMRFSGNVQRIDMQLENGVELTQVALTSQRAVKWLESCLYRVYAEERSQPVPTT